eukprot:Gb_05892 [translate_table: standard]
MDLEKQDVFAFLVVEVSAIMVAQPIWGVVLYPTPSSSKDVVSLGFLQCYWLCGWHPQEIARQRVAGNNNDELRKQKQLPQQLVEAKTITSTGCRVDFEPSRLTLDARIALLCVFRSATGRSWKAPELRLKSWDDLHKLWEVCKPVLLTLYPRSCPVDLECITSCEVYISEILLGSVVDNLHRSLYLIDLEIIMLSSIAIGALVTLTVLQHVTGELASLIRLPFFIFVRDLDEPSQINNLFLRGALTLRLTCQEVGRALPFLPAARSLTHPSSCVLETGKFSKTRKNHLIWLGEEVNVPHQACAY